MDGFLWISVDFYGFLWIPMDLYCFYMCSIGFNMFLVGVYTGVIRFICFKPL
jgi:hypothetical protein